MEMASTRFRIKTYQIVLAQIIAIVIWVSITVIQWANNPKGSPGLFIPLVVRTIEAVAVLFVTGIFIIILERNSKEYRVSPFRIILIVLIYIAALLANLISLGVRNLIGYAPPKIEGYFFIQSLHFYIPIYILLIVYVMTKNRFEAIYERENKLKAENLAQQARWLMLRYQINPHFLFNTLNTIRALVGVDDDKARSIITDLSQYFRYSLSSEEKEIISIDEELKTVKHYLEIQNVRFQDKLKTFIHVSNEALYVLIPVFTIQMLVENAIKYGQKSSEGILRVIIDIKMIDKVLHIIVKNSGHIIKQDNNTLDGTRKGIANFRERLNYIYPEQNDFKLEEKDGFVIAHISLYKLKNIEQNVVVN